MKADGIMTQGDIETCYTTAQTNAQSDEDLELALAIEAGENEDF